ncbi:hypothetical protein EJ02DRAFT_488067 [Clathrospora elynae]|uniref:AB hydrolase-1 domain-containing protein n=1 Tax=Clathrospora elynae TaxID=706981 RepID=A0A6A5SST1_9PLEO|nr:hypothetical protein EJ02DRAFT_488067 [Clathrospora elynae]
MASVLIVSLLVVLDRIKSARAIPTYSPTNLTTNRPSNSFAQCIDYNIPLNITSENVVLNITPFHNDFDVVDLVTDFCRKVTNTTVFDPIGGLQNVTSTYQIAGIFCSPKNSGALGREKTVILGTHGVHYDGRYWDSSCKPQEYSFVEGVVKEGYSAFFYNRLGTRKSEKQSGYTNQAAPQTQFLAALASLLRHSPYTHAIGKLHSVVLVGQSFGSYLSNAVLSTCPTLVDAAVLTGFSFASDASTSNKIVFEAFAPRIAAHLHLSRFSALDTGYLTFPDKSAQLSTFFKKPAYEPAAANYAHEIAQPFAIAEILTLGLVKLLAPLFTGLVLLAAGEFDFAVCAGESRSTFEMQTLQSIFPNSRLIEEFVQLGVDHGVNFGQNATGFYKDIVGFLGMAGF